MHRPSALQALGGEEEGTMAMKLSLSSHEPVGPDIPTPPFDPVEPAHPNCLSELAQAADLGAIFIGY